MRLELLQTIKDSTEIIPVLKTSETLQLFGVFQDSINDYSKDSNGEYNVGYMNFYGFWNNQDHIAPYLTNSLEVNKTTLKTPKKLFNRKFMLGDTSLDTMLVRGKRKPIDYSNNVLFDSFESAKNFIDLAPNNELYKPLVLMVEVPANTATIHCQNGVVLAENYRILY